MHGAGSQKCHKYDRVGENELVSAFQFQKCSHFSGNPLSFMSGNARMKMTIIYISEA